MDSDDEREDNPQWKGVPATVFLINGFNSSTAAVAYEAVCRMIRKYLRLSSNYYISVCIYGVKNPNTSNISLQDVIEVFPLSLPTLDIYKKLQDIDVTSYEKSSELKLSEALWHSSNLFGYCKKQLLSRTVIIMSKLDVPPAQSDHNITFIRVAEFASEPIDIKIVNIAENTYDHDPFYANFAVDANISVPKPVWDCLEIEKLIYQQSHRHMAVAQLSFEIGNGLDIGVGIYKLLKTTTLPKSVKLDRDTNAVIQTVNKTMKVSTETTEGVGEPMDEDEGEDSTEQRAVPLLKSEVLHYQEYGGERIEFTHVEKKTIDNPFGPPMMKLLGFKPAAMMHKEKWFLKPGYFLYPNENIIEGSTAAFKALHKACVDMSVVAMCILCTRVNSRPHIVALSPCANPLGLDVEVGFDVIHIPFVENNRDIPAAEEDDVETEFPEEQIAVMKDIINSIKFDYKPDMFKNPKLEMCYRSIEEMALSTEPEPFVDTTKPSPKKFKNLHEDLFDQLFGPFREVAVKRVAKDSDSKSKRAKVEDIDEELLKTRLENNQVSKYTVDQLKTILRSKDIPNLPALTGLKKAELVKLVCDHC